MSFITSPGIIVPPLTAGGVAYGTGSQAKVTSAGTAGQVLTSAGAGVPTFATVAANVSSFSAGSTGLTPATATTGVVALAGTLAVGSGGTNLTTLTANNVIIGNGAAAPLFVAPGTSGNVLSSNGTTWASTAPVVSGVTSFSGASTGLTPSTATTGAVSLAGTLAVASGGTSLSTLTANNVIIGNGTSAPTFVAPSTSGNLLTSDGTTWQSTAPVASGFSTMSVFTSSTTFTIPTGKTTIKVTVIGGGAGGSITTTGNALLPGVTGNTSSVSSGTQSITTVSASGGTPNQGAVNVFAMTAGFGGVGSNGDINFFGGSGGSQTNSNNAPSGNGGNSFMGGGAPGFGQGTGVNGFDGQIYGGGGSGGNASASNGRLNGGAGGGTAIKYLTNLTPGNTLTITVAASAAGGNNGTNFGGNGAQGVVIIEF